MLPGVTRNLVLPLHERLRGREAMVHYRRLRQDFWQGKGSLRDFREARLQALIGHCLTHVPFYRDRLKAAGVGHPQEVTLDALSALPPLERDEVRANLDGLCADSHRGQLIRYSTGGSTGQPLVFYTDRVKEARHNAYKLYARSWFGVRPGDRQVDFWGSPIELSHRSRMHAAKDRWLLNQTVLSAFDLTASRLEAYIAFLKRFRPRLVYGYPTVIFRVAAHLRDRGIPLGRWRPELVACTAEALYDHERKVIGAAFECPVVNEYGSRDAGLIAHESPGGALRVAAEHVVVEVDQPRPDGVGDLLVTNLDAYGMPLLRYRVGDRASLGPALAEGSTRWPTLGTLAGRSNDFLVGRGNKLVHSLAPIYVLREIPGIRQFKVVQYPDRSLEIQLVTTHRLGGAVLGDIQRRMRRILDLQVPVRLTFPDTISPEESGKYRWVVSHAAEAGA